MSLNLDLINILIALAAATNLLYGFLVYTRNKSSASNLSFFALAWATTMWGLTMIVFRSTSSTEIALFAARGLYVAAAAIPTFFVLFAALFPNTKYTLSWQKTLVLFTPLSAITLLIFAPSIFIQNIILEKASENIILFNFTAHVIYALYVAGMFLLSYLLLIRKYIHHKGVLRSQIIYILLGALVPTLVGLFSNLLLPLYNEFRWNWVGQISIAVTTSIITYGIFRHRIFNIRIIATEILIFFVWFIAFLRIIFAETQTAIIFNVIAFLALLLVGVWLIRSVSREVDTREKLEELTGKLQHANARLRELDRQKSEFLSIATHQLRGPLAGIRGHLSLILDGSYGKVSERSLDIIRKIFISSGLLTQTINDFLDVSRIEQNSMQYDMTTFKCSDLLNEVVEELQPIAAERKLTLTFVNECDAQCTVHADYGKLRHIFSNLIDNALKYTERGWVKARMYVTSNGTMVRTEISDSGIGIATNEIEGLFEKFVRARDAAGINIHGTGLGLYVAREMVEAHKGKVWAESPGKGEGSTFIVEIPRMSEPPAK